MQPHHSKKTAHCRGNILFVILIAVALFSALTFTISRSSKTVTYSSEGDNAARVHEILGFAEHVYNAVNRVQVEHNCRTSELSFETPDRADYHNNNSPEKCHIFGNSGGSIYYSAPSETLLDASQKEQEMYGQYLFTANVCVDNIGSGSAATCASDNEVNEELLLILPWISEQSCATINRIMGNPELITDDGTSFDNDKFIGQYDEAYALGEDGKKMPKVGCFKSTGTQPGNGYHFYYTLIAK